MEWKSRERIPLSKGATIELNGSVIVNDDAPENVGKGGTCLVYHGHVQSGQGIIPGTKVIIKEFYPESEDTVFDIDRERDSNGLYGKMLAKGLTKEKNEYKRKFSQFMQGLEVQKELSKSTAMEVAVKPWMEGEYGDGYYIISDIHTGCDIKKYAPKTLESKLEIAVCVAESMGILHEAGYIMLDFKPDNLMYIEKPNTVRIIDTDSIVSYQTDEKRLLFGNLRYASPEVRTIYIDHMLEERYERNVKRERKLLQPISDIYSLGVFLVELFWNRIPEKKESSERETLEEALERMEQRGELLNEFMEFHVGNTKVSRSKLEDIGKRLITIIKRATYFNRNRRKKEGFDTAWKLMKELNNVYYILTSEALVPRKEIAKANASFAAYNILQKYPLFEYSVNLEGGKYLSVTLVGNHIMLGDMLGAVISIGQMLDMKLRIHLTGENVEKFWDEYVSEEKNFALKRAVSLSKDGQILMDNIDYHMVDRALAEIELHTEEPREVIERLLQKKACDYFVLLEEESELNKDYLDIISAMADEEVFVGYLQFEEDDTWVQSVNSGIDVWGISAFSFSETYNEKMFEERIYRMGMMAHAYYKGCMKENITVDMSELEREFKQDIYSIESSERCALHSIYKMASLGIESGKPGRILNYYRKIQDSEVLERLAWLEHLSWTGYMLTSGARPVDLQEFERYAYKRQNDWKCKDDKKHLRHPLLVASKSYINEMNEPDPLDQVSSYMYRWYMKHNEEVKEEFELCVRKWEPEDPAIQDMCRVIVERGRKLINGAEQQKNLQRQKYVDSWKSALQELNLVAEQKKDDKLKEIAENLEAMMRPVVDAYRDFDFKGLDRELVFAAVDMLV